VPPLAGTVIRPYSEGDADALWDLKRGFERSLGEGTGDEDKTAAYRAKLDDDYRAGYLDWVERCVDETAAAVQVAERGGDPVGCAFVLPESMAYVWDAAVLNELFVVERNRGTDVGDALLESALAVARTQDLPLDRLVLDVDPENERALSFYERWGFEPWGEIVAREL